MRNFKNNFLFSNITYSTFEDLSFDFNSCLIYVFFPRRIISSKSVLKAPIGSIKYSTMTCRFNEVWLALSAILLIASWSYNIVLCYTIGDTPYIEKTVKMGGSGHNRNIFTYDTLVHAISGAAVSLYFTQKSLPRIIAVE